MKYIKCVIIIIIRLILLLLLYYANNIHYSETTFCTLKVQHLRIDHLFLIQDRISLE